MRIAHRRARQAVAILPSAPPTHHLPARTRPGRVPSHAVTAESPHLEPASAGEKKNAPATAHAPITHRAPRSPVAGRQPRAHATRAQPAPPSHPPKFSEDSPDSPEPTEPLAPALASKHRRVCARPSSLQCFSPAFCQCARSRSLRARGAGPARAYSTCGRAAIAVCTRP